jgi:hypothetical protein
MERLNNLINIEDKNILEDKEMIFDSLIIEEIIRAFINDLEDAGFDKEEVDEFLNEINKYDINSIKGILAMPKELRVKNFSKYRRIEQCI